MSGFFEIQSKIVSIFQYIIVVLIGLSCLIQIANAETIDIDGSIAQPIGSDLLGRADCSGFNDVYASQGVRLWRFDGDGDFIYPHCGAGRSASPYTVQALSGYQIKSITVRVPALSFASIAKFRVVAHIYEDNVLPIYNGDRSTYLSFVSEFFTALSVVIGGNLPALDQEFVNARTPDTRGTPEKEFVISFPPGTKYATISARDFQYLLFRSMTVEVEPVSPQEDETLTLVFLQNSDYFDEQSGRACRKYYDILSQQVSSDLLTNVEAVCYTSRKLDLVNDILFVTNDEIRGNQDELETTRDFVSELVRLSGRFGAFTFTSFGRTLLNAYQNTEESFRLQELLLEISVARNAPPKQSEIEKLTNYLMDLTETDKSRIILMPYSDTAALANVVFDEMPLERQRKIRIQGIAPTANRTLGVNNYVSEVDDQYLERLRLLNRFAEPVVGNVFNGREFFLEGFILKGHDLFRDYLSNVCPFTQCDNSPRPTKTQIFENIENTLGQFQRELQ